MVRLIVCVVKHGSILEKHKAQCYCLGPIARPQLGTFVSHSKATARPHSPYNSTPIVSLTSQLYEEHSNKDTSLTIHALSLYLHTDAVTTNWLCCLSKEHKNSRVSVDDLILVTLLDHFFALEPCHVAYCLWKPILLWKTQEGLV